jgi:hypothetical protein
MNLCGAYLSERGITEETVKAYGLELDSRVRAETVKERLGRTLPKGVNEILWIPLYDSAGKLIGWIARPLPRITGLAKFICALGSDGAPFIPKGVYGAACGRPFIVNESPLKAIACAQAGFDAVGLNGVYGAGTRNSSDEVVIRADLQRALDLRGRKTYLGFDADSEIKPQVRRALFRTFFLLTISGAEVFRLRWDINQGNGLDDYLVSQSNRQRKPEDVLKDLMAAAKPFIETVNATSQDLGIVCSELVNLKIPKLLRFQLCKQLAGPLGVRAGELEEETSTVSELQPEKKGRLEETIEPWPEPVIGADLLQEIFGVLQRFVHLADRDYVVSCLWTLLAYTWDVFYKLPILRLKSPVKGCGKSTLLDVLEVLIIKPLLTVSVSPAGLYRLIEKYHPCVLIDEADSYGKENDDLRNIVNGGYERGRPAIRVNKDSMEPEFFDTFGCKALASIGALHETIEDRSIIIDMKRKPRNIQLEELCDVDQGRFVELRRKIQWWTLDNREKLKIAKLTRPTALLDRPWNKWRPLLTIAHVAGGHWFEMCLSSAIEMSGEFDEQRNLGIEILSRIRTFFRLEEAEFLPSDDIIAELNSDKEAPWADWQKGDKKGITTKKLSSVLKPFKIKSEKPQIDGKRSHGYWLRSFKDAFESYLQPDDEKEQGSV